MRRLALLLGLLFPLVVLGCAEMRKVENLVQQLNNAKAKYCGLLAEEHKAEISARAQTTGLSFDQAVLIFREFCAFHLGEASNTTVGSISAIGASKQ